MPGRLPLLPPAQPAALTQYRKSSPALVKALVKALGSLLVLSRLNLDSHVSVAA